MSIKNVYATVVLLLALSFSVEAGQDVISINYPPDKSVREYGLLGVSFSMTKGTVDRVMVRVNGREETTIVPDIDTECFEVSIEPGVNKVELVAYKEGAVVVKKVLEAFRRSDLISEHRKVPKGFKVDSFHMQTQTHCRKCHVLDPSEYDVKPISPATFTADNFDSKAVLATTSTCYSCHKKIMSNAYVHGPASVWSCLSCHDADSIPEYSVKTPDTEMCYECHTEQKKDWLSKKFVHGPVNMGKCTICHSPHSTANAFNLFKSTWDLCINCHAEKADGVHIFADALFKDGHPTRDRDDPVNVGKELTCASCHNPHASNFPPLWAFEVSDLFELCSKCHDNYSTR